MIGDAKSLMVFDKQLNYVGEIANYKSMIPNLKYRGISQMDIVVEINQNQVGKLLKGYTLVPKGRLDQPFRIHYRNPVINDKKEELTIKAYSYLKYLGQRWTIPPDGLSHEVYTNQSPEYIVKSYINSNAISPVNPKRILSLAAVKSNLDRGIVTSDKTRQKNLANEILRVLEVDNLGVMFELNPDTRKIEFDVYEGTDRSYGNTAGNKPVVFSLKLHNLEDINYIESDLSTVNSVYVAGPGEGASRTIVECGEAEGDDRYETVIDARDIDTEEELINRGISRMVDDTRYLKSKLVSTNSFQYLRDYFTGDIVTIIVERLDIAMNVQIAEVEEVYSAGRLDEVKIAIGKDAADGLLNMIKQHSSDISQLNSI